MASTKNKAVSNKNIELDEEEDDEEEEEPSDTKPSHIMLSYQWDNQKLVEKVYKYLTQMQAVPVWMDVHGGMQSNIFDSMSEGVKNCSVLVCFLTPAYQNSANCKKELNYALSNGTPIIPCMVGAKEQGSQWRASGWLGMSIAGILYLDFTDLENNDAKLHVRCQELIQRINATI